LDGSNLLAGYAAPSYGNQDFHILEHAPILVALPNNNNNNNNNNNKDTIHALASWMPSAPRLMEADTTPSATSMSARPSCMHPNEPSFLQKQSNGIVHNCTFIIPEIT